jgi:hypothetical protein
MSALPAVRGRKKGRKAGVQPRGLSPGSCPDAIVAVDQARQLEICPSDAPPHPVPSETTVAEPRCSSIGGSRYAGGSPCGAVTRSAPCREQVFLPISEDDR